ncbi:MAG: hypothetical protein ACREP7_12000 [Lysobacter sp.]
MPSIAPSRSARPFVLAGILALSIPAAAVSAPLSPPEGSLDPSFGVGGIASTQAPFDKDRIVDMAVQPDGKLLTFAIVSDLDQDWRFLNCRLFRWQSNGQVDSTFGDGGVASVKLRRDFSDWHSCRSVAVQEDGKILVGGSLNGNVLLMRYKTDGQPDTAFGSAGVVTAAVGAMIDAYDIVLQADGKIVVAINDVDSSSGDPAPLIARFETNGSLDPSFGTGGVVMEPSAPEYSGAFSRKLKIQPDGKIVVVGDMDKGGLLARYLPNGQFDTAFGNGGIADVPNGNSDMIYGVALQADGAILTSHRFTLSGPDHVQGAVLRYLADGRLDTGFVSPKLQGGGALALQADGRMLVMDKYSAAKNQWLQRINPDGSIDTQFQVPPIDFGKDSALIDLALQADGRIVIGAEFETMLGGRIGLARLINTTYCLQDPTQPERFIGFSDSGWFSTANLGGGGEQAGFVGRGTVQPTNGPWRNLTAFGAAPGSRYSVASLVHVGPSTHWGFANVMANGKAPTRYAVLDTHIADSGCGIRAGL